VGDALASSKRRGKSTGFLPATYTAGGQTTRFPIQIAALHRRRIYGQTEERCGRSEGELAIGRIPRVTNMRVAPSRILVSRRTVSVPRIRGSSPSIDCGFDARRTSHPVAVLRAAGTTIPHSRGHRAREGGSTLYCGISQPMFATVRPPGSNGADQASWNLR
jgi:hypothetical protein